MQYNIPGLGSLEITTIVLDLNGTMAVHGKIVSGVKERLEQLKQIGIEVILFSGDHRGNGLETCNELGITFKKGGNQEEKEKLFLELDPEKTAAIGNARIDIGKFKHAKLSIATLQSEGIHTGILQYVDIIVPNINDALDLFIDANALEATMRL